MSKEIRRATDAPGDRSPFALGLLLRRAHDRAARALAEAVRPLGLELRHFAVLIALHRAGPLNQRDLATDTGMDKATMVRVVDDLEAAGLAERRPVAGDRRVREVAVTEKGLAAFDAAHEAAAGIADGLVAHLRPGEREQLTDLLLRFTHPGTTP